jgi:hypothetical protein
MPRCTAQLWCQCLRGSTSDAFSCAYSAQWSSTHCRTYLVCCTGSATGCIQHGARITQLQLPLLTSNHSLLCPLHCLQYYYTTTGELGATRYGAVTLAADTGSDVSSNVSTVVYNVLVNASAKHAAPVFASLVHSAALQAILANTTAAATSGNSSSGSKQQQEAQAAPIITIRYWSCASN